MIFFDKFKVPTIKFGKCFAEFMIPTIIVTSKALKKFGSKEFVTIIEVSNIRRCSGKANNLKYIYTIRGTSAKVRQVGQTHVMLSREFYPPGIQLDCVLIGLFYSCTTTPLIVRVISEQTIIYGPV